MKRLLLILFILPVIVFGQNDKWDAVYSGTTEISKIYKGEDIVWEKDSGVDTTSFIMAFSIDDNSLTIPLYNTTGYDMSIDWGDGSTTDNITTYNDSRLTHSYTSNGNYDVSISGTCKGIYFNNTGDRSKLDSIRHWGNVGFETFNKAFYGCSNLVSLPIGSITGGDDVTSFSTCFGNTSITSIPSGLFDNNTDVTAFSSCFFGTNITSIPSGLFDNNTSVTVLNACFYNCNNLTLIPSGLFDNNTAVTNFSFCFFGTNITSIPSGLFDNNTAVTSFNSCFNTTDITSIPSGLFDNNTAVTDFRNCFYNCTSTSGTVDELWNDHPSATGTGCFYNCTGLTNYSSIPTDWK